MHGYCTTIQLNRCAFGLLPGQLHSWRLSHEKQVSLEVTSLGIKKHYGFVLTSWPAPCNENPVVIHSASHGHKVHHGVQAWQQGGTV